MLLATALAAVACSVLPPRQWPSYEERTVQLTYRSSDGPMQLPSSSPELTVLELKFDPLPEREYFRGGIRFASPSPGTDLTRIRCRYRAYAVDGALPAPEQLFPGAMRIDSQTSP